MNWTRRRWKSHHNQINTFACTDVKNNPYLRSVILMSIQNSKKKKTKKILKKNQNSKTPIAFEDFIISDRGTGTKKYQKKYSFTLSYCIHCSREEDEWLECGSTEAADPTTLHFGWQKSGGSDESNETLFIRQLILCRLGEWGAVKNATMLHLQSLTTSLMLTIDVLVRLK